MFPLDGDIPVNFTRALYPYPMYAKYKGSGDPNDARSFAAVPPAARSEPAHQQAR
jgi:feruloyl esterase